MKTLTQRKLLLHFIMLLFALPIFSQSTITGTVIDDETGDPLIGVNITIESDPSRGAITDLDGMYSIVASEGEVLVFSYTGMTTQKIKIEGVSTIDLSMSSNLILDEVIITGYGNQLRSTFTGSAASAPLEPIAEAPRANFQEGLQGTIAGLQVNQGSGQPGAFQNVRIRGLGSINAGTNPLYVIDGIPVINEAIGNESVSSTPLAGINPMDIKDIQVLKDASATSIYGSRGANGVIIITTKQGKVGKPQFNVNVQSGVSDVSLSDKLKPLNASEYIELLEEGVINRGLATDQSGAQEYLEGRGIRYDVDTDWFDALTQQGSFTNANFSVAGGTEESRYFISAGYQENEGTIIGTKFERASARLNLTNKMADWLTVDFRNNVSYTKQRTVADGGAFANPVRSIFRFAPTVPIFNEDGSYNLAINSGFHPIGEALDNERYSNILNLFSAISAVAELPIEGLTYEPFVSINRVEGSAETFFVPDFGTGNSDNGSAEADFDNNTNWLVRNMLKYSTYYDDTYGIDITAGHEAQKFSSYFVQTRSINFAFPQLTSLSNGSIPDFVAGDRTQNRIESYFLNTSFNYKGLVYLNGTVRRDGSSRFGSGNRYGTFWSLGSSANLNRFSFMENNNDITALRIRASYGENGNESIGNFASRGLYATGTDYLDNPGIFLSQLENSSLSWEVNKQLDIGLEVGLWNRIDLTIDWYDRRTSDLLFDRPVSLTNGVAELTTNIGELQNTGWEFAVTTYNITSNNRGFEWNTNFNITFNNNKVISLPDGDFADGSRFRGEGLPWSTWYIPGYAGVDPQTGEPNWYTDETESEITTVYGEADPYIQGTSEPDFFGGFTNTFSYKGLSIATQFNFDWGRQILHAWGRFTHTDGQRGSSTTGNLARSIYDRRWQEPGDITDTPQFIFGRNRNSQQRSTRFLYDGSFITLRDLSISYDLPASLTDNLKVRSARIFMRGSNLWIYTKDERLERDPRTDAGGVIDQEVPIPATYTFGLDVSF